MRDPVSHGIIPPGAWLGLLGGGQLGRMFCMAAQSLGYRVVVLDPADDSPAGSVADRHIRSEYLDRTGLGTLADVAAGVTTEFENVPAAALEFLARHRRITPPAAAVAIAQDRLREKEFLGRHGFAIGPCRPIVAEADLAGVPDSLFPAILKSARLGYDGKGQMRLAAAADLPAAFARMGRVPCMLEAFVELVAEVSVVVARGIDRATTSWPVAENRHRDGILDVSIVPARVPEALAREAREVAVAVADALDYRGILCVEMFVTRDGELLVNEIAPRPHNSGHYTIDACTTSQFEQQARILAGLPLGDTQQHSPAVMVNLLGDLWFPDASAAKSREPAWQRILVHPKAKLHLYGKSEPRRGRKMGHVTCLGDTPEDALTTALAIRREFGIDAGVAL